MKIWELKLNASLVYSAVVEMILNVNLLWVKIVPQVLLNVRVD